MVCKLEQLVRELERANEMREEILEELEDVKYWDRKKNGAPTKRWERRMETTAAELWEIGVCIEDEIADELEKIISTALSRASLYINGSKKTSWHHFYDGEFQCPICGEWERIEPDCSLTFTAAEAVENGAVLVCSTCYSGRRICQRRADGKTKKRGAPIWSPDDPPAWPAEELLAAGAPDPHA